MTIVFLLQLFSHNICLKFCVFETTLRKLVFTCIAFMLCVVTCQESNIDEYMDTLICVNLFGTVDIFLIVHVFAIQV